MSAPTLRRLAALDLSIPERIGHYRLGERIGAGTCGVVHRAIDERTGATVALKLSPASDATETAVEPRPTAQRAFEAERLAAASLSHPDIVRVIDTGREDALNVLAMEYVDGTTLQRFCRGPDRLPASRSLAVAVRCARMLQHAHERGVLHRDVKPANLMLGRDGRLRLLDFGIATAWADAESSQQIASAIGTPNYMAPEQVLKRPLSPQTDQYGLAAILFELLTGRRLFRASDLHGLFRRIVSEPPPDLGELRPDLPRALARVLIRALAKSPAERFQTAEAFASALEPFIAPIAALERRPAALIERMRHWRARPSLAGFSEFDLARLLRNAQPRIVGVGDPLLGPRREACAAILASGEAVRTMTDGDEALLVAGDIVGGDSMRLSGVSRIDAIARRRTTLLEVRGSAYRRLSPTVRALCLDALEAASNAPATRTLDAIDVELA